MTEPVGLEERALRAAFGGTTTTGGTRTYSSLAAPR